MIVGFGPCYAGGARRTSGVGWLGATNSIAKTVRDTLAASRCPAAARRKAGPGNAPAAGALLFPKSGRLLHEQSSGWVRKQKQFGGTGHETPFGNGNG